MTHAALTPLLGREFDSFLFAPIDDDRDSTGLSVVSALARLDVDPWKEAVSLARMPRELAVDRLTSLIASMPNGPAPRLTPQVNAARLIGLLPQATRFSAPPPAATREIAPIRRSRLFVALGIVAFMLIAGALVVTRSAPTPGSVDAPAKATEPAARP